jgi:hypothetical protein
MEITKEKREELYKAQCNAMKAPASASAYEKEIFNGSSAFCAKDFKCYRCGRDLLSDPRTLESAEKGYLITGCPFCCVSYCD